MSDARGSSRQRLCGKSSPPPRVCTEAFHADSEHFPSSYVRSITQFRRSGNGPRPHALYAEGDLTAVRHFWLGRLMFGAGTKRRVFRNPSGAHSHALSRAELESSRARGPVNARCEFSRATVLRPVAQPQYSTRFRAAYGHLRSAAGPPRRTSSTMSQAPRTERHRHGELPIPVTCFTGMGRWRSPDRSRMKICAHSRAAVGSSVPLGFESGQDGVHSRSLYARESVGRAMVMGSFASSTLWVGKCHGCSRHRGKRARQHCGRIREVRLRQWGRTVLC